MKNKLGFVIATFIGLATLPAMAQDNGSDQGGPGQGQRFQQMKTKILQRMKDREACIEAANNFQDLRGCMPQRGGQGGNQGGQNGPGGGEQGGPDDGNGSDAPNN